MKNTLAGLTALSAAITGFGFAASAQAFDLTNIEGSCATIYGCVAAPYVTYGDGNSYSLPVLGILYDVTQGGGFTNSIQPGNPYYVNSSPGLIKDLTVIGTGSDGVPVTTNIAGMDDSYPTPNSDGSAFFTTNKDAYGYRSSTSDPFTLTAPATVFAPADPGDTEGKGQNAGQFTHVTEFTGDGENTWDIRLTALDDFVGTESPIFFFNNNQVNSGDSTNQNLAIWAVLTLYDDQGVSQPLNLYFTNNDGKFALVSEGGGGVLNGTAGSGSLGAPTGPDAGNNDRTDYVLSGGALCYTAGLTIVSCSDTNAVGGPINHNLGADQAVYAVVFPKLSEILNTAGFGGYDSLSLDWRMGCDPRTTDGSDTNTAADCTARSLNNGYEQLFIGKASTVVNVPEPGTLALLGSALLGLAAIRRRSKA